MKTIRWSLSAVPEITSAGRYPMPRQTSAYFHETVALHQHDYEGEIQIAGERFFLRRGDVTLTPAGAPSRYQLPAGGYHLCIHFNEGPLTRPTVPLPLQIQLSAEATAVNQRLWWIIDLHRRSFKRGKAGAIAAAAAAAGFQEMLLWLGLFSERRRNHLRPLKSEAALDQLVLLLERRFAEILTMPEIAREVGLSQNYLARSFQERYGMSIPRYLLIRRVELARHLLTTTDDPIKAIAAQTGLGDPHYFNKQFRRQTGLSPSEFRLMRSPAAHGAS